MSTATKVRIPRLGDAHKPFADAARARGKAQDKLDQLREEARESTHNGRTSLPLGLATRTQAASMTLAEAQFEYQATERDARSLAHDALVAGAAFKAVLAATLASMVERAAAPLEYSRLLHEAGQQGIKLLPLPVYAAGEVEGLRSWVHELRRHGLIALDDVPAPLAALMPGGDGS